MSQIRIAGGTVYDPANGIDGEVRDVCIDAGRIVGRCAAQRGDDRRAGHGRHAGRRGHPLARRKRQRQPGAAAHCPRSTNAIPCRRPICWTRSAALGHRRDRAQHVHDRLPVCRPRLHDGVRRRRCAAQRAALARGVRRHADRGRRVLRADGQRRVPAAPDRRAASASRRASTPRGSSAPPAATPSRSSTPAASKRWKRGDRGPFAGLDAPLGSSRVTPRAILETLVDAGNALRLAPRRPHPLQQPRRGRQRRRPRWRACAPSKGGGRTSRTCSSTRYGSGARRRPPIGRARAHRVRQRAPGSERRRRPGDVRPRDHAHGRRPRRVPAAQEQRAASG